MEKTKETTKKIRPIKITAVSATLNLIPEGETVIFNRSDLGSEGSVRSAVCRANAKAGRKIFEITLIDYGMKYQITRY